ncbi:lipopolysaccharide assembly protein LapA domain-containing protein [Deinococcus yavapaiensis]|uniref:lipopolysaccharide assembly protein LapA domain-containing protein n=1 Tax=Deinococcus yavapaiensis TaxID=309889 RepID=UPI000DA19733|nr:lipopolysaccharide assembly protein LapA domain-containing protein [Deinococcus yavapaiensis]
MRVVLFLQVVVLLALAAYVVLLQLENPVRVMLPLPGGNTSMPLGLVLGGGLLIGAAYTAFLFLPAMLRAASLRRQEQARRREAETKLGAALQAKLAATPPTLSVAESADSQEGA